MDWESFDPLAIDPRVLAKLTPRQAGLYGAVPLRNGGERVEVALAEPLARGAKAELETLLLAGKETSRVVYRFAPLSDVAFAVRWAWSPAGLQPAVASVALLRRLGLIDEAGEGQLWRVIRAGHHRLGDLLVRAGAIDHETLYWARAARNGGPSLLGDYLAGQGLITPADLALALAKQANGAPPVLDAALALGLIAEGDAERVKAEVVEVSGHPATPEFR